MVDSCLHCKFRNGAWCPRAAFQDRVLSFEDQIIYIDTTIGYKYSFVNEKSKDGVLYLVDNVENGIILSPEGRNFEGRPREN